MNSRRFSSFAELEKLDRNTLLMAENPSELMSCLCGNEVTFSHVIRDTQDFIQRCYDFGLNPLPHLRKYFPGFQWTYREFRDRKQFVDYVSGQDYVWIALVGGDWATVVCAKEIAGSVPRRLCVCSQGEHDCFCFNGGNWSSSKPKDFGIKTIS